MENLLTLLMTKREAADLLRVCPATILRMIRRGDLRGFTVAKTTRVTIESIESLLGASFVRTDGADHVGWDHSPGAFRLINQTVEASDR